MATCQALSDLERAAIQIFLARNLEAYVEDQMSVRDLQEAFPNLPGIESLTIADADKGRKVYTIGNKSTVVEYNTTIANIGAALARMQGVTLLPTNRLQPTQGKRMGILGLQQGALKGVVDEMRNEIGSTLNQGIADARAAKETAKTQIKATVDDVKAKVSSEVADVLHELADLTNGPQT